MEKKIQPYELWTVNWLRPDGFRDAHSCLKVLSKLNLGHCMRHHAKVIAMEILGGYDAFEAIE